MRVLSTHYPQHAVSLLEGMRRCRALFYGSAVAAGLALGACTTAQESQILAAINASCLTTAVGTSLVIDVASNIPGSVPTQITTGTTTVQSDASKTCSTLLAGAQTVIEEITAAGGTATVTVSSTSRASSKRVVGKMKFGPRGTVYVITPFHL